LEKNCPVFMLSLECIGQGLAAAIIELDKSSQSN